MDSVLLDWCILIHRVQNWYYIHIQTLILQIEFDKVQGTRGSYLTMECWKPSNDLTISLCMRSHRSQPRSQALLVHIHAPLFEITPVNLMKVYYNNDNPVNSDGKVIIVLSRYIIQTLPFLCLEVHLLKTQHDQHLFAIIAALILFFLTVYWKPHYKL